MNKRLEFHWKYIERPKRKVGYWFDKLLGQDSNEYKIAKEVSENVGELVLVTWQPEICMLLGWSEDEDDYYYVVQKSDGTVRESTCVGGIIPLRDSLNGFLYEMVKNQWRLTLADGIREVEKRNIILKSTNT
jgi:hypothetical protein